MSRHAVVGQDVVANRVKDERDASEHSWMLGHVSGESFADMDRGRDQRPQSPFFGLVGSRSVSG